MIRYMGVLQMVKSQRSYFVSLYVLLIMLMLFPIAQAQDNQNAGEPGRESDGPNPLNNVYFGEQHLHTQDLPDAFAMGTRNTVDDAYNFCKGEAIKKSTTGMMVQKQTPYDWCAVTDHAYLMGLLPETLDPKNPLYKSQIGKLIATGKPKDMDQAFNLIMQAGQAGGAPKGFDNPKAQRSAWERQKESTNKHNEPGKFTTLIAFEWTSIPYGQNCTAMCSSATTRLRPTHAKD